MLCDRKYDEYSQTVCSLSIYGGIYGGWVFMEFVMKCIYVKI